MKKLFVLLLSSASAWTTWAASTIDPISRYAYGSNVGWVNCLADTNNGAVIGQYVCSGYIYSGNVGWINLGSGAPTNGIQYQNKSKEDFGVNTDGLGNLRGYAWGANIGWVTFEDTGAPKVNLLNGQLCGYVWSANCGWISLSNAVAFVQTDVMSPGQLDSSGLPIAWELIYFGQTGIDPNADPDGDGMSNYQEYLAGTNPTNSNDYLRITAVSFAPGGTNAALTWTSTPTRYYLIQKTPNLNTPNWVDSGLGLISPSGDPATMTSLNDTNAPTRFYRVQAVRPLLP